jgi:hypothetical protein
MARQSDEVQKLKRRLANVQKENDILKEKVKHLENNFSIELFSALEAIRGEYNSLLNPAAVKVKASHSNHTETFLIRMTEILWIQNSGRLKKIFLRKPLLNEEQNRTTMVVTINDDKVTMTSLKNQLDRHNINLAQVEQSYIVNVGYFNLNQKKLDFLLKRRIPHPVPSLKLTPKYESEFKDKKRTFVSIWSFQKRITRSKV